MNNQLIYQIGLTMIKGVGDVLGRHLLETLGSPEAVFAEKTSSLEKIPGIGSVLASEIRQAGVLKRAEKELSFVTKNNINCYFLSDSDYPARLRECCDAPLIIYFKGKCDLNSLRIISVVGTRRPTDYGSSLTNKLVSELAALYPGTLIVSGLAYGIDVASHRSALNNHLPTVGVLAHGLDRIYPFLHRKIAIEMLEHGGLLTDFPSGTTPDKPNFVMRNRIIAGLSDATVVVESAEKGGSLITANIAFSYDRDVFAFPGRTTDTCSQGCNRLISQNKAALITCAADLVALTNWGEPALLKEEPKAVQTELFFDGSDDAYRVLNLIKEKERIQFDQIVSNIEMPVGKLMGILIDLEIDGKISVLPGKIYKIA
ncbi:MAG: DNA-processing protein DprA [Tannerellaceae bacterium]|jgi:DNA processing protein|nr:DNA-processing protein DprA [Tannerellaceae bacterium]